MEINKPRKRGIVFEDSEGYRRGQSAVTSVGMWPYDYGRIREELERALFVSNLHFPADDTPIRREDMFDLEDFFCGFCDTWMQKYGHEENSRLRSRVRELERQNSLACENYARLLKAYKKKKAK